jgi:predicted transglutaminase-like cysteine proteinase
MFIKTALYVSLALLTGSTAVFAHSDEPPPVQFHEKLLAVNSPSTAQKTVPRAPEPAFAQNDPATRTVIAQGVGKDVESAAKNAAENALTQVVGTFIQSDKFLNKRSEINNGIKEQSRSIETKTLEYAMQPSFDPSAPPGYQMVQLEKAPHYPPGPGMPGGGSTYNTLPDSQRWNKDAYQPQTTEPAQQSGPGIVDVWNKDRMTGPPRPLTQDERHKIQIEQDQKRYEEYLEIKKYGVLKKDLAKREEQYRLQKEQRWQQMRDSVAELSEADQVFVQAEVLLRPGISDLPDVSVYEFVERILHAPMDNGQLPRLIQIIKRDNEYTIDIQMKNRVALLFRHDLSPSANGRTAMLQSAIFTVTFARGHKVDPPEFFEMTPLEFATFMSATPGWNASLTWRQQQQPQRWPKFNIDPQQQQQPVQQPQQVKPKYPPGPGMTEEENPITRLPTEQIEDPNVLRDPISQKPLVRRQAQEEEKQKKQMLQPWLDFDLYPSPKLGGLDWSGHPVDPGSFKFDWHVNTAEVNAFLAQEKIYQRKYSDAVNQGQLDAKAQQYVQKAGKEAFIKTATIRDVNTFVDELITRAPQGNWRSPQEVFKLKEGDGKSYVVAKMAMLRALGFQDKDMVLVVGFMDVGKFEEKFEHRPTDSTHVILGVNVYNQDWVFLDDLQDNIQFGPDEFLQPSWLINNQGLWTMRKHG